MEEWNAGMPLKALWLLLVSIDHNIHVEAPMDLDPG
jgi:hypothetical protein